MARLLWLHLPLQHLLLQHLLLQHRRLVWLHLFWLGLPLLHLLLLLHLRLQHLLLQYRHLFIPGISGSWTPPPLDHERGYTRAERRGRESASNRRTTC